MKNIYMIEEYDVIKDEGNGFLNSEYTNKQKAIQAATSLYKNLCNTDKKHIIFIVQKMIDIEEFIEVYETKIKK